MIRVLQLPVNPFRCIECLALMVQCYLQQLNSLQIRVVDGILVEEQSAESETEVNGSIFLCMFPME